jgi:hypothetical protein
MQHWNTENGKYEQVFEKYFNKLGPENNPSIYLEQVLSAEKCRTCLHTIQNLCKNLVNSLNILVQIL